MRAPNFIFEIITELCFFPLRKTKNNTRLGKLVKISHTRVEEPNRDSIKHGKVHIISGQGIAACSINITLSIYQGARSAAWFSAAKINLCEGVENSAAISSWQGHVPGAKMALRPPKNPRPVLARPRPRSPNFPRHQALVSRYLALIFSLGRRGIPTAIATDAIPREEKRTGSAGDSVITEDPRPKRESVLYDFITVALAPSICIFHREPLRRGPAEGSETWLEKTWKKRERGERLGEDAEAACIEGRSGLSARKPRRSACTGHGMAGYDV